MSVVCEVQGPKFSDYSRIFPVAALLVRLFRATKGSLPSFDGVDVATVLYIQNGK